jgi:hypothetical protein
VSGPIAQACERFGMYFHSALVCVAIRCRTAIEWDLVRETVSPFQSPSMVIYTAILHARDISHDLLRGPLTLEGFNKMPQQIRKI